MGAKRYTETGLSEEEYDVNIPEEVKSLLTKESLSDEDGRLIIDKIVLPFIKILTNIDLYTFQQDLAAGICFSLLLDKGYDISALQSRQCIAGDQIVLDRKGVAYRMSDSPNSWITGRNKEVFRLQCKSGFCIDKVTKEHIFFTKDGERQLKDIKVGDEIAVYVGGGRWLNESNPTVTLDSGFHTEIFRTNTKVASKYLSNLFSERGYTYKGDYYLPCGNNLIFARYTQSLLLKLGITSTVTESSGDILLYTSSGEGFNVIEKSIDGEQLSWSKVISIESNGYATVYDREVPNKGWFVCQGIKAHNSGKSETISCTVFALGMLIPVFVKLFKAKQIQRFQHGFRVGIYGPDYDKAAIIYERIKTRAESKNAIAVYRDKDFSINMKDIKGLSFPNGFKVDLNTAGKGAKIEGKTYDLLIVDEAQDVNSYIIKKCLAGDTQILQPDGSVIDLKTVVENKLPVITPTGVKVPTDWYSNGVQEVYEIELTCGFKIKSTHNHKFHQHRRGWKIGHWAEVKDLKIGDRLAVFDEARYFGDKGSYEEGFTLGFFLGGGCMSGDKPLVSGVKELLKHLEECNPDVSLSRYKTHKSGLIEGALTTPGNSTNPLTTRLKKLGVWGLCREYKTVPTKILNHSEDFFKGFISGIFETDGCIGTRIISFGNISEDLVLKTQHILRRFGIHSNLTERPESITTICGRSYNTKRFYVLTIKGYEDLRRFHKEFTLITKQGKLDSLVESTRGAVSRHDSDNIKSLPNSRWSRIKSIRYVGAEETYCVTVDSHMFWANGIVSHNSLYPMLASTNGVAVLIGTPIPEVCEFSERCYRNAELDDKYGHSKNRFRRHYEFDWTYVAACNPSYMKHVKKMIANIGRQSDEFRMAYGLEWLDNKGKFISYSGLTSAGVTKTRTDRVNVMLRGESLRTEFKRPAGLVSADINTPDQVFSIDYGKNNDSTVITIARVWWDNPILVGDETRYHLHIHDWYEMHNDDLEDQYPEILKVLSRYKFIAGINDATGMGDPIHSRLAAELYPDGVAVHPFKFSSTSKDEGYKLFRQELAEGRFTFPWSEHVQKQKKPQKFIKETRDLVKEYSSAGVMKVRHPDGSTYHDDYPDSAMMLCWLVNKIGMRSASYDYSPLYGNRRSGVQRRSKNFDGRSRPKKRFWRGR